MEHCKNYFLKNSGFVQIYNKNSFVYTTVTVVWKKDKWLWSLWVLTQKMDMPCVVLLWGTVVVYSLYLLMSTHRCFAFFLQWNWCELVPIWRLATRRTIKSKMLVSWNFFRRWLTVWQVTEKYLQTKVAYWFLNSCCLLCGDAGSFSRISDVRTIFEAFKYLLFEGVVTVVWTTHKNLHLF